MAASDKWAADFEKYYDRKAESESFISTSHPKTFLVFKNAFRTLKTRLPVQQDWTVLDVGCGGGYLCQSLGKSVRSVTGIDVSGKTIAMAQQHNPTHRFIQTDLQGISKLGERFDCVVASSTLEYLENKPEGLREIAAVLKSNGWLYAEVQNADFVVLRVVNWLKRLIHPKKQTNYTHHQIGYRNLTFPEWASLLKDSDFDSIRWLPALRPWNYGPLSNRLKGLVILLVRTFFPVRFHYMLAFTCRKK